MDILLLFRDPSSKYFLIPLVSMTATLLLKISCQNDHVVKSKIELFYWAPSLITSNFILIFSEYSRYSTISIDKQMKFSDDCMNSLILNLVLGFLITLYIRKYGWKRNGSLSLYHGIIIPDAAAFILMYLVMKGMTV